MKQNKALKSILSCVIISTVLCSTALAVSNIDEIEQKQSRVRDTKTFYTEYNNELIPLDSCNIIVSYNKGRKTASTQVGAYDKGESYGYVSVAMENTNGKAFADAGQGRTLPTRKFHIKYRGTVRREMRHFVQYQKDNFIVLGK